MKTVVGLCKERHNIPVDEYIFPRDYFEEEGSIFNWEYIDKQIHQVLAGTDEVELYVTGLTTALTCVINWCYRNNVRLTLCHYNRANGGYVRQEMLR